MPWRHILVGNMPVPDGHDDKPMLIGDFVPVARLSLGSWPQRRGVHADDEGRWLRRIVAPRDIEQVFPLLARGNDGAAGVIWGVARYQGGLRLVLA